MIGAHMGYSFTKTAMLTLEGILTHSASFGTDLADGGRLLFLLFLFLLFLLDRRQFFQRKNAADSALLAQVPNEFLFPLDFDALFLRVLNQLQHSSRTAEKNWCGLKEDQDAREAGTSHRLLLVDASFDDEGRNEDFYRRTSSRP